MNVVRSMPRARSASRSKVGPGYSPGIFFKGIIFRGCADPGPKAVRGKNYARDNTALILGSLDA